MNLFNVYVYTNQGCRTIEDVTSVVVSNDVLLIERKLPDEPYRSFTYPLRSILFFETFEQEEKGSIH